MASSPLRSLSPVTRERGQLSDDARELVDDGRGTSLSVDVDQVRVVLERALPTQLEARPDFVADEPVVLQNRPRIRQLVARRHEQHRTVHLAPQAFDVPRLPFGRRWLRDFIRVRAAVDNVEHGRAELIADGGVNAAGDFVKALVYSDGVMMGKFFASGSFEDEVLIREGGKLIGVHLYGMASAMVTEKRNFIEGSSQTLKSFHQNAAEAVTRLREGLQSAMTYVNATDLGAFRKNVRFAINSHAAIVESGVH